MRVWRMKNIGMFAVAVLMLSVTACKKDEEDGNTSSFDQKGMLTNMRTNVIAPAYANLYTGLTQLKALATAFTTTPNTANLASLKLGYESVYEQYQAVSSFDFGPAADVAFRGMMNTYPVNHGIIEGNIVVGDYNLDAAGNIAANGLPTIDYLLYSQSDASTIDLFSMDASKENRAAYLHDVIHQMEQTTWLISQDWNTGYGDGFEQNTGTGVGSSVSLLINAMVQDYERYIRDGKVGIPAGVRSLGVTYPDKVEAYNSAISNTVLKASLVAFQNAFNGQDGLGLDDYLVWASAATVKDGIQLQLQTAITQTQNLPNVMAVAVDANASEVKDLYQSLQQGLIMLKVDMPSALSVLITYQDSDGD